MATAPQQKQGLARVFGAVLRDGGGIALAPRQREVLGRILACGTGSLGAHVYRCGQCQTTHVLPHSCRDRHCPRCQKQRAGAWLESQQQALLPAPYFHVVFTLPHQLNALVRQNKAACLGLLFKAASSTLLDFGRGNLGATLGLTAVLHTWGQSLCEHYHLHVLVTGGGLALSEDEWVSSVSASGDGAGVKKRRLRPFLFATRALGKVFQARYLEGLEGLHRDAKLEFHGQLAHWREGGVFGNQLRTLSRRRWCVYAKAPFAGPSQVLTYLSLYTHRVAISEGRVQKVDEGKGTVTFRYKDYANGGKQKLMTLGCVEFTRRFCQHILPRGFCKIRHYGILSTRNRKAKVALCRILLGSGEEEGDDAAGTGQQTCPVPSRREDEPTRGVCPNCGALALQLVMISLPQGLVHVAALKPTKPP
jgi:hypothetical protein